MRRRRILVLVVIWTILNVALAQEEPDFSFEDNKGDEENGYDAKNKRGPSDIADNDDTNGEAPEPSKGSKPSQTTKPSIVSDNLPNMPGLPHQPQMHLDKAAIIDEFKHKEGCQCDEGLDCKCDNSTSANIDCHCADFDNLAKVNEGYSCKCEKHVSRAVKLKCQCARKDSKVNVVKTITCTSSTAFTQSHIRNTSGIGGKLQLYNYKRRVRKISYEHQPRFTTEKNYDYSNRKIEIPPNVENQIEVIYRHIVQEFKTSDQSVVFCTCPEKHLDCTCENSMLKYKAHYGLLDCFCVADYFYADRPLRCACNPFILQPKLVFNNKKYDFRYITCLNRDVEGLILHCNFVSSGRTDPFHPVDTAVVTLKTPLRNHFADILEYIQTYEIYALDVFNLCDDCKLLNGQIVCNCRQNTENHTMLQTASCLCLSTLGSAPECMCGPQILQIGIVFHDIRVKACRCYHSAQDKTNLNSLVCRECHKRKLFEYKPIFSSNKQYLVGSRIEDDVQNQIEYIYPIVVKNFSKDDQLVNMCQCLPDLKTCNCKYAVKPYFKKDSMPCLCISDYYYTEYPYQCACNPFILGPGMKWDNKKLEIRHLDCVRGTNSTKHASCTERLDGPKPPSAEHTFVMRLGDTVVTTEIISHYLSVNELYEEEPLISCDCKTEQGKYSCDCSESTTMYNIHNKGYCLCVTHKNNQESTQCLCNPRILQFGLVFNSESNLLEGCKCYHSLNSFDEYSLICGECHERKSLAPSY